MESWFDERFLSVAARDHEEARFRAAAGLGLGLLVGLFAGWAPALAWMAGILALEVPLWRLTRGLVRDGVIEPLHAAATLLLQLFLTAAWSFAGLILWNTAAPLAQAAAMAYFAALLTQVCGRRGGSQALFVSAVPALLSPLGAVLLLPQGGLLERAAVLALATLGVAQAGLVLARSLPDPGRSAPLAETPSLETAGEQLTVAGLAQAKAEAEAANRAKSAFLAIMSHEIRTPLNGVLGMTQALAADPALNPSQRARLATILRSGESLLAILNDILDISKVEAGKLKIERTEFDLGELLSGVHESFVALAAQKGVGIRLALDAGARGTYLGDPTRVRQVVSNLVSNALKFTYEGEIAIAVTRSADGVGVAVTDTGVGIEAAEMERLFEKFEQADLSSTRRYGGTGLGLAICRELCELMGGSIRAESEPGRGATFTVVLPLPRVGEAAAPTPVRAPVSPDLPDGAGLRVLAAEDDKTNQQVLKALLAPAGVDPTIVEDGQQAVEAWSTGEFDLILMDIQMPVLDGLSATRAIRQQEAELGRPPTMIFALTANSMPHHVEEYLAAGMDGHLAKPVQMATLHGAIRDAMARLAAAGDERAAPPLADPGRAAG